MKVRWIYLLLFLVGSSALLWFVFQRAQGTSGPTLTSSEIVVERADLEATVSATGVIAAQREARLSLATGGTIAVMHVETGSTVSQGDALLVIETTELALRVEEAIATLSAAEAELAEGLAGGTTGEIESAQARLRAAQLALTVAQNELDSLPEEEQGSSQEAVEVEEARASLEQSRAVLRQLVEGASTEERTVLEARVTQARARLALAQTALAGATLRAPYDGLVIETTVQEGERLNPSQTAVTIVDPTSYLVIAEVDEVDVARVEVGQPVTITLDAYPTQPLSGEVLRIAPAAITTRGATTYQTHVSVDPSELAIRLDMAADVQIRTTSVQNALLLPRTAIRYAESQPFVLVRRNGQVVEQEVVLGAGDDRSIAVLEGLIEGEIVITP